MKYVIVLLFAILLVSSVSAQETKQGSMKLLAISELSDNTYRGTTADLELEITPGSGRVFMSSSPASKVDTQISTTFANQVVCKQFNLNCDEYDFFYTINAGSSIVGGPSAGAAVATLTVAVMNDITIDNSISMSGTINSGGIIGPVGGLKEKVEAASDIGLTKVLIPKGERFFEERELNVDLLTYGEELGVSVIEVADVFQALSELSNNTYEREEIFIDVDSTYADVMKDLADNLCNSAIRSKEGINYDKINETLIPLFNSTDQTIQRGLESIQANAFYSGASMCFSGGISFRYISLLEQDYTIPESIATLNNVESEVNRFDNSIPNYKTLTDLQTYIVVKDRISEARSHINRSRALFDDGSLYPGTFQLAYAIERLNSAKSWSTFFGKGNGSLVQIDTNLAISCSNKIAEATERYNYVRLFFPEALQDTQNDINLARQYEAKQEYELCLFEASKINAEANTVLSVLGIRDEQVDGIVALKLSSAEQSIMQETQNGNFPIVGYSYYEYAKSLNQTDKYSALLYSEYALELSNLDIYLKTQRDTTVNVVEDKPFFQFNNANKELIIFFSGIAIGLLSSLFLNMLLRKKSSSKKKIIVRKRK